MANILVLLQSRRVWAGISAMLAFFLPMMAGGLEIDANILTESIMKLIEAISGLAAIILPILSYFKPKK
jgi:amino acid permease